MMPTLPLPAKGPNLIEPEPDDVVAPDPFPSHLRRSPRLNNSSPHLIPPNPRANAVINEATGQSMNYRLLLAGPDNALWLRSMANDLGRLAQGVRKSCPAAERVEGTNTIFFIPKCDVPINRTVTYCKQEATIRPTKAKTHRVRNVAGGNRLDFPGPTATQTASLTTIKVLVNSTISTPRARFSAFDIKNFYYGTPMSRYEYMKLHVSKIPAEILTKYKLPSIATTDGWIYMEIRKGMPGLKQAGCIANDRLKTHLAKFGYRPVRLTPSLWTHDTRPVDFSLVVDNFGVKYAGHEHAMHLLSTLRQLYTVTKDWAGTLFNGLTIQWNYPARYVDISMPEYIPAMLHKFQHPKPAKHQGAPHAWTTPTYGANIQYATPADNSPVLPAANINAIQQKIGTLLYYAVSVDPFMLPALGTIASSQARATPVTRDECTWLMD
jgi:hypothetical protein